jgi:hypothetical protein
MPYGHSCLVNSPSFTLARMDAGPSVPSGRMATMSSSALRCRAWDAACRSAAPDSGEPSTTTTTTRC